MDERDASLLEARLRRHFARAREATRPEAMDRLVRAMVAEDARVRGAKAGHARVTSFVASQVRYIPAWTWAAQAALVALMCVLAHAAGDAGSTKLAIGVLSALCALVGASTVQASRLNGVAELEYACVYDTASVMVARMIALGCSSALAVAIMVGVTALAVDASAFEVALWACPPLFLSCAGSLMALRRAHPATATMLCVGWVAACSIALLALSGMLPDLYADTSLVVWASAAAAALAWMVREVMLCLRATAAGLDVLSPQLARTYN